MPDAGLRELKKARTRQLIADTAARLFAERGYEQVAVSDVAREAEVAEQTVYNYFPTKEQLVDRSRPTGSRPAVRPDSFPPARGRLRQPPFATSSWSRSRGFAASRATSGAASSATWRPSARPCTAWRWRPPTGMPPPSPPPSPTPPKLQPEIARLQGMALAGVFQVIISEAGNRTRQGQSQAKIADELYPIIGRTVDELDRWFQASEPSSRAKADGRRRRRS